MMTSCNAEVYIPSVGGEARQENSKSPFSNPGLPFSVKILGQINVNMTKKATVSPSLHIMMSMMAISTVRLTAGTKLIIAMKPHPH